MRQLERVIQLLEQLGARGEASLADLTRAVEAPRASVHRLLVALQGYGYVQHVAADAVYRLGPAVLALASRGTESALVRLALPALTELRATTGETVNLAALDGQRIVYLATLDGLHQPRMSAVVGAEAEPHATALGKAVLAAADPATRERLLPPEPYPAYTAHTITSRAALDRELSQCARRGFAVESEESSLGAACIAVAIAGPEAPTIGGISISGVPARLPAASHEAIAAGLRRWTDLIWRELTALTTTEGDNR
jgi:IclR family acetate operon transcriptional repressor